MSKIRLVIKDQNYENVYYDEEGKEALKCPICGQVCRGFLVSHITRTHKISTEEFSSNYPNCKTMTNYYRDHCRKNMHRLNTDEKYANIMHNVRVKNGIKLAEEYSVPWNENKGLMNWVNSEEGHKKRSETFIKTMNSPGFKEKHLEAVRKSNIDKELWKNARTHSQYEYNGEKYDSSWEVTFVEFCDRNNIKYVHEPSDMKILYEWDDRTKHYYYPDFYLIDYQYLVEIKPKSRLYEVDLKLNLSKDISILIITEDSLFLSDDELLLKLLNHKYGKEVI